MTHKKRKAFTLTELLVVVVIIGVLSAVVLPKFTKMLEGRKTTEAEEMMTAVRNEQEARCTMGKNYIGTENAGKLSSYKAGKNFSYELESVGMLAKASSGKYTLEMPSYIDGRICCSGDGCEDLNKNYPSCDDLTNTTKTPDFVSGNEDCGVLPPPDPDCVVPVQTTETVLEKCGCTNIGTKSHTRKFDTEICAWGNWDEWTPCTEKETNCESTPELDCEPGTEEIDNCKCGKGEKWICNAAGEWDGPEEASCPLTQEELKTCSCHTKPADEKPCEKGFDGKIITTYECKQGEWVAGEVKNECVNNKRWVAFLAEHLCTQECRPSEAGDLLTPDSDLGYRWQLLGQSCDTLGDSVEYIECGQVGRNGVIPFSNDQGYFATWPRKEVLSMRCVAREDDHSEELGREYWGQRLGGYAEIGLNNCPDDCEIIGECYANYNGGENCYYKYAGGGLWNGTVDYFSVCYPIRPSTNVISFAKLKNFDPSIMPPDSSGFTSCYEYEIRVSENQCFTRVQCDGTLIGDTGLYDC